MGIPTLNPEPKTLKALQFPLFPEEGARFEDPAVQVQSSDCHIIAETPGRVMWSLEFGLLLGVAFRAWALRCRDLGLGV